jgi:hypothetical protein
VINNIGLPGLVLLVLVLSIGGTPAALALISGAS